MGLFSALAGVGSAIGQGLGGLIGAGFGVGQQVLTGVIAPALGSVGQLIPSILGLAGVGGGGSSSGPGAVVTGPVGPQQPYYLPPAGGGGAYGQPYQYPQAQPAAYGVPPGWVPAGQVGGGVIPAQATVVQQFGAEMREQAAGSIASPWKTTCGGTSLAAQNHLQVNPATGAIRWFGPKGKPILWSDDLAACKRVKRVATRAGKVLRKSGGRY